MTLLSSPQGTPERVWSLLAGLSALGGGAARTTYDALLNPGFEREGGTVKAKPTLAADAHSAASSLKLVETTRDQISLTTAMPDSYVGFADFIHDRLVALDYGAADSVVLEGFAWIMAESDRLGEVEWIYQTSRSDFADRASAGLTDKDMNPTKVVAWRRWLSFVGLGVVMPSDRNAPDFPSVSKRLVRELERSETPPGTVLAAADFIALIARRMPYLDRGRLFGQACQRIGHSQNAGRLSPLLSAALREVHDDQTLRLVPSGDAADRLRLSEDPAHSIDAFTTVVFFPGNFQ